MRKLETRIARLEVISRTESFDVQKMIEDAERIREALRNGTKPEELSNVSVGPRLVANADELREATRSLSALPTLSD